MRNLIAVFLLAVLMTACAGSKGCGCPNWGNIDETDAQELMVFQSKLDIDNQWVWM